MAQLVLNLLGTFQATLDGRPVDGFEYDKVRALLAYLAVESDRPHRREKLIGLLWPGYPEGSARRSLAQALYLLRNALGDRQAETPFLLVTPQAIQFNRASDFRLDVDAFLAAVERGTVEDLEDAVGTYRGRFLSGLSLDDCPAYDEWVALKREALHRSAVEALHRLAGEYEKARQLGQALRVAQRQVALDPYWEAGQRTLMRLLALRGQRNGALAQYEALRAMLAGELGVEPEPETTAVYEAIRAAAEGTLPERAGAVLQRALRRARWDRGYQLGIVVGVVTLGLLVVLSLGPFIRGRRAPEPRNPLASTLADGRPLQGLSLWPEIDLQPRTEAPVMELGPSGSQPDLILAPTAVDAGGRVYVYYTVAHSWPGEPIGIAYANATEGTALQPGVLYNPRLAGDGLGFDAWAVGLPALMLEGHNCWLYYAGAETGPFGAGLAIGRAVAHDPGGSWTRDAEPVLEPGPPGEWDSCSVAPGSVVATGSEYRLYYLGSSQEDCTRWSVGLATSADGIHWIKHDQPDTVAAPFAQSDPLLVAGESGEWDGHSLSGVAVRDTGLDWEMFYTGEGMPGRRAIGYAWSHDGLTWYKHPDNPVLQPEDDPYATDVIEFPTLVVRGSRYQLYYDYGPTRRLGLAEGTVDWPILVNTTRDELNDDGDCSLREAIEAANRDEPVDGCPAGEGRDRVIVSAGTYALTLHGNEEDGNQTGDLDILDDLVLQGAGAEVTLLDGDGDDRVIDNHGASLTVEGLTLMNGREPVVAFGGGGLLNRSGVVIIDRCIITHNAASYGGGLTNRPTANATATMALYHTLVVSNTATGNGGGLLNLPEVSAVNSTALLTVTQSTLMGNVADGSIRTYGAGCGGAIASGQNSHSDGSLVRLTIIDSTLSGNLAAGTGDAMMGNGGAIVVPAGEARIINSTISGNRAAGVGAASGLGGGVLVSATWGPGSLVLVDTTVTDNRATGGGAVGVWFFEIYTPTAALENTIVAGNQAADAAECLVYQGILTSHGHNIEDGDTCHLDQPTDLTNSDPLLGPLADNGGPTWTHAPLPGSPAVDAGRCATAADQRGYPRPVDIPNPPNAADGCDIGAVELQPESSRNGPIGRPALAYRRPPPHPQAG